MKVLVTLEFDESPISAWFELTYAQFLTVPRLVMESMPLEWQEQMAGLLDEMDETFDWRPKKGSYWVKLRDAEGRFSHAPLNDYRRGSCEHLRIRPSCFGKWEPGKPCGVTDPPCEHLDECQRLWKEERDNAKT